MQGKGGDGRPLQSDDNYDPELEGGTKPRVAGVDAKSLRGFVERIESLEEQRCEIGGDIKDVKAEAKSAGFDVKVLNAVLKLRRKDPDDVDEFDTLVDVYMRALS